MQTATAVPQERFLSSAKEKKVSALTKWSFFLDRAGK